MRATYALKITYKEVGIGTQLKAIVSKDIEGKVLKIIVTIDSEHIKNYDGLKASVEFCDNDNTIEDIGIIMKDKGFWGLIGYYQKEILDASFRGQLLLNDTKIAQEAEDHIRHRTNLLADLMRILFSRSESKIKSNATADILFLLKSILQKLNVYTSFKVPDQEEVTIAKTYLGYRNLTLFDRKFPGALFYLHLANVILANQLILKPATDFIAEFERAISLLRSRALPFSLGIFIVNLGFDGYHNTFSKIIDQNSQGLDPTNLLLSILPLIWPLLGLCVRRYGSKIVSIIVRYAINRILNTQNYKNSFWTALPGTTNRKVR